MEGPLDATYLVALVAALWATGLALGISHDLTALVEPLRRTGLLLRIAAVDLLLFPIIVWALVQVVAVPGDYAVGLVLVGIASAGPLGIKATQIARADVATAIALVIVLELGNLVATPLWAAVLLPSGVEVDTPAIVRTLIVLVVLPLVVGAGIRRLVAARARRLATVCVRVADLGVVVVIAIVLLRDGNAVLEAAGERVPLVAAAAILAALILGWAAGAPARGTRVAGALVTGIRANAVALAIAAASFPQRADVRAGIVVFALFSVLGPLAFAALLGRRAAASVPAMV